MNLPGEPGPKSLPLVLVGGYFQTYPTNPAVASDFQTVRGPAPTPCLGPTGCTGPSGVTMLNAPFSDVQRSLATGKSVGGLPQSLVTDVNAEANTLTAIICHADGKRPTSVCGRAVIRRILTHVK